MHSVSGHYPLAGGAVVRELLGAGLAWGNGSGAQSNVHRGTAARGRSCHGRSGPGLLDSKLNSPASDVMASGGGALKYLRPQTCIVNG